MDKIVLIYVGRILSGSALVHKYLYKDTRESMTFKKKIADFYIGTFVECEKTETGVKGPYNRVGYEADSDVVRQWLNRDRAYYDEHQLITSLKKPLKDMQAEAIQLIRKSYKDLPGTQRLNFINRLIYEITK